MTKSIISTNTEGVLSRSKMKQIMAGNTNCLICWNDDGADAEEITYGFTGEDPDLACRRNGPYSTGSWGQCSDLEVN